MEYPIDFGERHWYAACHYLGVDFSYDSDGWFAYIFNSKAEREEWLSKHSYNDQGNLVAEPVSRKIAFRITGLGPRHRKPRIEINTNQLTYQD